MKVISKFLTAEVRIVRVHVQSRRLVVEGVVKELMPMRVEVSPADAWTMLRALVRGVRERATSEGEALDPASVS